MPTGIYIRKLNVKYGMTGYKGKAPWNKGLTKETDERVKKYVESSSQTKKGQAPWNKGKTGIYSEEYRRKLSEAHIGYRCHLGCRHSEEAREKMSESRKGKKHSEEWKIEMSERFKGENNPSWQGGISFELYPPAFNQQLKDRIRVRDNFICQKCGVPELECNRRLTTHHIDYDKRNCEEDNLTSLCAKCNGKVNSNREYWTEYFQNKLKKILEIK